MKWSESCESPMHSKSVILFEIKNILGLHSYIIHYKIIYSLKTDSFEIQKGEI